MNGVCVGWWENGQCVDWGERERDCSRLRTALLFMYFFRLFFFLFVFISYILPYFLCARWLLFLLSLYVLFLFYICPELFIFFFFFFVCVPFFRRFISSFHSSIFLNFIFTQLFSWFTCRLSAFFKIQDSSVKTQL